jgi:hypothetical protein
MFTFVTFNVFGDAVSLAETRWLLSFSKGRNVWILLAILLFDFAVSALIYLILPSLANERFDLMVSGGIRFQGPQPWLGIMFWSTFATSLFLYVFVVITLLLTKIVTPLLRFSDALNTWFSVYQHPMRLFALAAALLATAYFAVAFWRDVGTPLAR